MSWKFIVWVIAISVGCTSASYTMLVPFLPMYLIEIGVKAEDAAMWSGAVFSVSFLVAAIMAPIWGKMADKKGKRLMALRAGICLGTVYLLGSLVSSPQQLLGMRILQGFANGFFPACMTIVSSIVPREHLGSSLGIVQTGQIIGTVMGPLVGGSLAHVVGMRWSFVLSGLVLFAITAVVAAFVKEPKRVVDARPASSILEDMKDAMHNRLLVEMLVLSFTIQVANLILQPVISLYVAELQGSMEGVMLTSGVIFSLGGIAGALSTTFWGHFGQRRGYFTAMVYAFCGAGVFIFLQYFPSTVAGFGVLQFLFGLFFVGANPAVSATLVNCTSPSFRGRVFGLQTTASQSGSMVGPLIGGFISTMFGIKYVFLVTGPLLFLLGIYLYYRHIARKKKTDAKISASLHR